MMSQQCTSTNGIEGKLKIWLINIGEQISTDPGTPRLLRTGILAQWLADRGHEVTWWNSSVNHPEKIQRVNKTTVFEMDEGYRLVLLHGRLYSSNISFGRILSQIENAKSFREKVKSEEVPDVILCGYPSIELAKAAVEYANENDVPIALDFRDMWPDVFEEYLHGFKKVLAKPLLKFWYSQAHYCINNATAICGVTDRFVDWALAKTGRVRSELDRAFHLAINPRQPEKKQIDEAEKYWDSMGIFRDGSQFIGCYPGTLSRRLDLQSLVKGLTLISDEDKARMKFVICGKGDLDQTLRKIAQGQDHIIFAGWRNASEVLVLLQRSHFGAIPYRSTEDFLAHFPNKFGEYLAAGLPIMTGLYGQTRELLDEHDLGYYFEEGNPQSVAECLSGMLLDTKTVTDKKAVAQSVFAKYFDGNQIYHNFSIYLEDLASSKCSRV